MKKDRLVRVIAGLLLLQGSVSACAGDKRDVERDPSSISFVCRDGITFQVMFIDGQVRVTTSTSGYDLVLRPSSIGQKYSSGETTIILDEDRAVLTGADGGPFKLCHEA